MTDPALDPPMPVRGASFAIRSPIAYALIFLFGLALYLPGLTTIPAIDRDESRFAQSSRQMLESGDYIDIRLQNEARLKKPVGIYWLQAAATALAGGEDSANPIWTYRLPSLAGALGSIMLVLAMGRRCLGAEAGFFAASLLAASLLLGVEARQAKTDAFLLLTILCAMAGLADAWLAQENAEPMSRWRWVGFWGAIGVGLLIKGPIIMMVVGLSAAALALWERRLGWMRRLRPWPGLLIAGAIALPWLIAITLKTHGAFWIESVGNDMAAKLATARESHGAPPGAYLALFPVTFWPGSLFALFALPWVWRNRRDRAVVFCLAWIGPSWIVFEIIPTKLPHYVLPLYPAIALLTGAFLADRLRPATPSSAWGRWLTRGAIAVWGLIGIALGGVAVAAAPLGDDHPSILGLAAGLVIWAITLGGGSFAWKQERPRALFVILLGSVVAWGLTFGAALPALEAPWIGPRLKDIMFERLPAGHGPVLIAGYREPSALIALGTHTQFGDGGEAARLLGKTENAVAIIETNQNAAFNSAVAAEGIMVEQFGSVSGFNYANGKRITLNLYRRMLLP